MKHSVRLARLEADVRERRERERRRLDRGPRTMTTAERRRRLAELLFEGRYGHEPSTAEISAYEHSPEHDADDRQCVAEFRAWAKAMPNAPTSTYRPFLESDKGKAAVAAELAAFAAREASGGVWYLTEEDEDAAP